MLIKNIHRWVNVPMILAIFASIVVFCISSFVYQQTTMNADENSYVFQANNFLDGLVARPYPPYSDSFRHKMIITDSEVGWLSRYAPGHSMFLVPGVLIGNPYILTALTAGLSLFLVLLSGRLLGGQTTGVAAGLLLLFSPFFLFYSGTLLSHTSGLLSTALLLVSYIYWRQTGDIRFAVLAGLAWAFFLNNRTYTALLMAIPLGLDSLWFLYRERTLRMLTATCSFAAASAFGLLALLFYNKLSVGDLWTMTYLYFQPTENLGFGIRSYGRVEHTFSRGLEILSTNVVLLDTWLWGFSGSLIVCLILFLIGWKQQWSRLFAGMILSVWFGYVFFWYQGAREAGPLYYFELLPFIVLGAAFGIQRILGIVKLRYVMAAMFIWLTINVFFTIDAAKEMYERHVPRRMVLDALQELPEKSLVFISSREHHDAFADGNDMIFNPRGLGQDIMIAHWLVNSNQAVMRYFHDYTPMRLTKKAGEYTFLPMPEQMHVDIPIDSLHRFTGENIISEETGNRLIRIAREGEHEPNYLLFGRYYHLYQGRFAVEFDVKVVPGENGASPILIEVASESGKNIIITSTVDDYETWITKRLELSVDDFMTIEPRILFHGTGEAQVSAVRVMEII